MAIFRRSRQPGDSRGFAGLSAPWGDRPSIHAHIRAHIDPATGQLTEQGLTLPDDDSPDVGPESQWAPGALEGVFGHHVDSAEAPEVDLLMRPLMHLIDKPSQAQLNQLYELIDTDMLLTTVEPLRDRLGRRDKLDPKLYALGYWFASEAADRAAVKFGIVMLSLFDYQGAEDLLFTLGLHDEFTLYAVDALARNMDNPLPTLIELAQKVEGWGRIHVVERLADIEDPDFKAWLLREGYKNTVMYEYLAFIAATTGDLAEALDADEIDQPLLLAAADILTALINGGPAEDMDDYEDAPAAIEQFLYHARGEDSSLRVLLATESISHYLDDDDADWMGREALGWPPEKRSLLLGECADLLRPARWRQLVLDQLRDSDTMRFLEAVDAASAIGMDPWDALIGRLAQHPLDPALWQQAVVRSDASRVHTLIELANKHLPLAEIASGPDVKMGLSDAFAAHQCLETVLEELAMERPLGWPLVKVGLQSPVIRTRYHALRVLDAWGRKRWPGDAEQLLQSVRKAEPDPELAEAMGRVLAGEPITDN